MNVTNITNFVVRTDTINAYMAEINKIPVLNPQEEKDLFAKYESYVEEETRAKDQIIAIQNKEEKDKAPEDAETIRRLNSEIEQLRKQQAELRNEIIARNLRFNFAVAKRYTTGDLLPDLINTGTIGMYEAFEKYNWHNGIRFCSFAVWFIRRAIYAYLNKENLIVRPKNNVRIAPKVKKIENDFFLKNGRKPYPIEVIDILRKDYGIDVKDELDIYGTKVDRIDSSIGEDEDLTMEKSPVFNEKTAIDNDFDVKSESEEMSYQVETMLKALTEREKQIVCMAYGYGYPREYKDKEIGAAIGLTSERVRQLRHGALKKMRATYIAAAE